MQGNETESLDILGRLRSQGADIVDHSWLGAVDNLDATHLGVDTLLTRVRDLAARPSLDTVVIWNSNLSGYVTRLSEHAAAHFTIFDLAEIGIRAALTAAGQHTS